MTISQWQIYRERIKAWEACKATMKLGKTQEELLTTSLENRHEVQHHNHKQIRDVPFNHIPVIAKERPMVATNNPLPGEIPLGSWVATKAQAENVSTSTIWKRIYTGKYRLKIRRINQRVAFVHMPDNFEI